MERGRWWTLPLLLLALVATGCAGLQTAVGLRDTPDRPIDPETAIAVSVPSGAVYLVDPGTGRRALIASGLVDFQAGYASWAPDHHRLAFGDGGIVIVDITTGRRQVLAHGGSVSMPAWSPDGQRIAYSDGTETAMAVSGARGRSGVSRSPTAVCRPAHPVATRARSSRGRVHQRPRSITNSFDAAV